MILSALQLAEGRRTHPTPDTDPLLVDVRFLRPLPASLDLIDRLEEPEVVLDSVPQLPSLVASTTPIDEHQNVFKSTYDIVGPRASRETVVDHLGEGASIDMEEDGVLSAARVVKVRWTKLDGVQFCMGD